jgi:hypothetical protein
MSRFDEMVRRARLRSGEEPPVPRIDPQTLGQLSADIHESEWNLARGGLIIAEPPPHLTSGDPLTDEIDVIETRINRLQSEISGMEEDGGGIRSLKFARQNAKKAAERARIDLILADVLPPYEEKLSELSELRESHRTAIARRRPENNPCRISPQPRH